MKKIKFKKKFKKPIYLALGMFDCVHTAHAHIIDEVCKRSNERNCLSAVFTFSDIVSKLYKKNDKSVYTFSERLERFYEKNVDLVIFARATNRFLKMAPEKFLNILSNHYNILGIVCGQDYTFGKGASGNITVLQDFSLQKCIDLKIVDTFKEDGEKISTSLIKELILKGDIEKANNLLGSSYFVKSKVVKGSGIGKSFLFPTANIMPDRKKLKLKDGVYLTKTKINNKIYSSLTNCGPRPSVDNETGFIETHVLDFDGNLYKKEITVYFYKRLRDTKKFENLEDLKKQIREDIQFAGNKN